MKGLIAIVLSVLVHTVAFVLALYKIEPIYTDFYSWAWWTYVFFLAGLNHLWARNSLLLDTPREALWVVLYSTPVWLFFELYNLRLENWHYVGVPLEIYLRWPGYVIAYGTVLPAVFETETFLRNLGLARRVGGLPLRVSSTLLRASVCTGCAMLALALIWPGLFFPFVWLGLIFLLDPVVYRKRNRDASLLGKAERGDYALLARLLLAGLVCGCLWEFWNHWAGAKWTYSIPYLGLLKIFEMPLLGFFGFPPFALECYLLYQILLLFRERFFYRSRSWQVVTGILVVLYCLVAFMAIDRDTIVTYKAMGG